MLSTEISDCSDNSTLENRDEDRVTVTLPDPGVQGALDVITLKSFVRMLGQLRTRQIKDDAFEKALAKVINVNGALAKALMTARSLDDKR